MIENWKEVLTKAWSVWLGFIVAILLGLEAGLPTFLRAVGASEGTVVWAAAFLAALIPVVRIIKQRNLQDGA